MSFDINIVRNILSGKYNRVPDLRKKVIRIFLSSTFTDTNSERDYLIEKIYPRLKDYCKREHDLDFQSVDMRWGIPSDAHEYHGTTELCLNEIKNCKKHSLGPNFVALVGQKYGLRPLPRRIDEDEFLLIRNEVELLDDLDKSIYLNYDIDISDGSTNQSSEEVVYKIDNVMDCYQLDTNSKPHKYRLLPISRIVSDYGSKHPKRQEYSRMFWDMIDNKLSYCLRRGAEVALDKGLISSTKKDRYFVSITEKEIFEGVFKEHDANKTSICFIRNIVNLEENINDPTATRFIDLKTDHQSNNVEIDLEAKKLIDDLKLKKIPSKLNDSNIFKFNVIWKDNGIESESLREYLEKFGEAFYSKIVEMIDEAMKLEKEKDKLVNETYYNLGLIRELQQNASDNLSPRQRVLTNKSKEMIEEFKEFITELGSHSNEYNNIVSQFFGRDDIMVKIRDYVLSNNNIPFVVTGESGCGKTNIMAIAHQMIPKWYPPDFDNYLIITRFLGTTTQTSSIFKTYRSIALQLHYTINLLTHNDNSQSYRDFCRCHEIASLKDFIEHCLVEIERIDPQKRIVFILDSLDQLTPDDYKNIDKWLLTNLPSNTKYIISTIPDHGNLLDMILKLIRKKYNQQLELAMVISRKESLASSLGTANEERYKRKLESLIENQIFNVRQLSADESELILGTWLKNANQELTKTQWSHLRHIFSHAKMLPLFLKLLYDLVLTWRSFDDECDRELLDIAKVDQMIVYLFRRMERLHGPVIFRRSVAYMTVCRNGISDNEMEDIMSIDDDVLYSVFQYHIPPVRRLPSILWIRIKNDLREYVVEKEANETKVIYWYHRRFVEVALNIYLKQDQNNMTENETIFQNIFDFYNETWKNKEKPFELNEYLKKKLKNSSSVIANRADRHLSSQPIRYIGDDGQVRYNKRKLTELPNCLASLNSAFGLEKACELIFFNYEFLHAKFKCESINEVNEDLANLMRYRSSWSSTNQQTIRLVQQLDIFAKCMSLCGNFVDDNPDSLAYEMTSRLLNYYGVSPHITEFINECYREGIKDCALVSPYLQQDPPGGHLASIIAKHHHEAIFKFVFANEFLFSYSRSRICVYRYDRAESRLTFLFDVELPRKEKLRDFLGLSLSTPRNQEDEEEAQPRLKCIFSPEFLNGTRLDTNPDLFPVEFLMIEPKYAYIIGPNRQLLFAYASNTEILDVFCLGRNRLVLVEKFTQSLRIFSDYKLNRFIEFRVVENNEKVTIKKCERHFLFKHFSTHIDSNIFSQLDLLIHLTNSDLVQYLICSSDDSDLPLNSTKIHGTDLSIITKTHFKSSGCHEQSLKMNSAQFKQSQSPSTQIGAILMNLENDVVVLRQTREQTISAQLYRGLLGAVTNKSPSPSMSQLSLSSSSPKHRNIVSVTSVEPENEDEEFSALLIQTTDAVFVIHPNRDRKTGGVCSIEIKGSGGRPEWCEMVSLNSFVICRRGVIEIYRFKCFKSFHELKLLFSVNSYSQRITCVYQLDPLLFASTADGTLSVYNLKMNKTNRKIGVKFDRALNTIQRYKILELNRAVSASRKSELLFWNLNDGKIIQKIDLEDANYKFSGIIVALKQHPTRTNQILVLTKNGELGVFSQSGMEKKISTKKSMKQKLVLLIKKTDISIVDIRNLIVYSVSNDNGRYLLSEQTAPKPSSIEYLKHYIVLMDAQNNFLLIEKHLKNFYYYSFNLKIWLSDQLVRFYDYKDEASVREFFSSYEHIKVTKQLKYKLKCLDAENERYFLSINVIQKINDDPIEFESVNHLLVVFEINRCASSNRKIEIEIKRAFSMVRSYFVAPQANILAFNYSNGLENHIKIIDLSKSRTKMEINLAEEKQSAVNHICLDASQEYLVYSDVDEIVWVYRISSSSNNRQVNPIARLPMYGKVRSLKFSLDSRLICANMNDRRLYSMLLVDPQRDDHLKGLNRLSSRRLAKQQSFEAQLAEPESDEEDDESKNNEDEETEKKIINKYLEKNTDSKSILSKKDDSDEESEEKETEKIKYLAKQVYTPIELNLNVSDVSKQHWLKNCLDKLDNKKSSHQVINSPTTFSDLDSEAVVKQSIAENNDEEKRNEFKEDLINIISDKENKKTKKMINFGNSVKIANSSKTCLIS